jgi:hypothetical protein
LKLNVKWVVAALVMSTAVGVSAQTDKAAAPMVKEALVMEDQVMSRFAVLGVDVTKRQIQLKSGDVSFKIRVRSGVPLDRIKAGDEIDATLVVREVVALRKGDGITKSEASVVEAPDGSIEGLRLDRVENVVAVDKANSRIRLSNANHQMAWLRVHSANVMADVKVGDQVRAVLTVVEVAALQAKP